MGGKRGIGKRPRAKKIGTVRASASYPRELYEMFEQIAKGKRVSVTWVIRDASEKYVSDKWPVFGKAEKSRERPWLFIVAVHEDVIVSGASKRKITFGDLIEEKLTGIGWHTAQQTERLLRMTSPVKQGEVGANEAQTCRR